MNLKDLSTQELKHEMQMLLGNNRFLDVKPQVMSIMEELIMRTVINPKPEKPTNKGRE